MSSLPESILSNLREQLTKLMDGHDCGGHDLDHFYAVHAHSVLALQRENLPVEIKKQVELAALLHDADDTKVFPLSLNGYPNARNILKNVGFQQSDIEPIISMIDLVSCSKNGSSEPPEKYMAIPRDCDRLEAIGQIGIVRCRDYTDTIKRDYHNDQTIRVYDMEQLKSVATLDRYLAYTKTKSSPTMLDHYYDKLLHIGNPEQLRSENSYVLEEAAKRTEIMKKFVVDYWTNLQK